MRALSVRLQCLSEFLGEIVTFPDVQAQTLLLLLLLLLLANANTVACQARV